MKSIIVAGAMAQKPGRGGHTWVFLQYLLGFKKLGWKVLFLDHLPAGMTVDEHGGPATLDASWNLTYMREVMCRFQLADSYAVFCGEDPEPRGLSRAAVLERVKSSSALLNVMGYLRDEEILAAAPLRVFLDIDPGFGQMWHALGQYDLFEGHEAFVTIGQHIGESSCPIPTCGRTWITTKPPVVIEAWPVKFRDTADLPVTSVISWRGAYGPVEYQGHTYRLRPTEFRKFVTLPAAAGGAFELALDIHPGDAADLSMLHANGWTLVPPGQAARTPWRYADYILGSAAELMVAKNMYVDTRSGWISDRSVCYMASGRPVLVQDTGISGLLPTGAGMLVFNTVDEAAEAVRAIRREPARHQRAARHLAEEHFDSSVVLGALVKRLGIH